MLHNTYMSTHTHTTWEQSKVLCISISDYNILKMKWESVAGHSRKRETVMQRINVVNIRYDLKLGSIKRTNNEENTFSNMQKAILINQIRIQSIKYFPVHSDL